eukprot:10341356-Heterocapsa_arctica.AAC.1
MATPPDLPGRPSTVFCVLIAGCHTFYEGRRFPRLNFIWKSSMFLYDDNMILSVFKNTFEVQL